MALDLLAESEAEADKWAATKFVAVGFATSEAELMVRPFTAERITFVLAAFKTLLKA